MIRNALILLTSALLFLSLPGIAPCFSIPGGNVTGANRMFLRPSWGQARALPLGQRSAGLSLGYSNEFINMASRDYRVLSDMECLEACLEISAGLPLDSEISLRARFYSLNAGVLDSALESYHDALGVGNYGRSSRPDDSFAYQITSQGKAWFSDPGQETSAGDTELILKKGVWTRPTLSASLLGTVKLPTGDPDTGLGSGKFDAQVMALADWKAHDKVTASLGGGYTWLSRPDHLDGLPTAFSGTWFGGLGLAYQLSIPLSLFVQSYYWEAPYSGTGIPALDRAYGEITFGGKYAWKNGVSANLALSEDLSRAAADFTLHTGMQIAF